MIYLNGCSLWRFMIQKRPGRCNPRAHNMGTGENKFDCALVDNLNWEHEGKSVRKIGMNILYFFFSKKYLKFYQNSDRSHIQGCWRYLDYEFTQKPVWVTRTRLVKHFAVKLEFWSKRLNNLVMQCVILEFYVLFHTIPGL